MPKTKLNLAMLNKKQEEMEAKSMSAVRAGENPCDDGCKLCDPENIIQGSTSANLDASVTIASGCQCSSIWNTFGLNWG